jgi:hypothetical protein
LSLLSSSDLGSINAYVSRSRGKVGSTIRNAVRNLATFFAPLTDLARSPHNALSPSSCRFLSDNLQELSEYFCSQGPKLLPLTVTLDLLAIRQHFFDPLAVERHFGAIVGACEQASVPHDCPFRFVEDHAPTFVNLSAGSFVELFKGFNKVILIVDFLDDCISRSFSSDLTSKHSTADDALSFVMAFLPKVAPLSDDALAGIDKHISSALRCLLFPQFAAILCEKLSSKQTSAWTKLYLCLSQLRNPPDACSPGFALRFILRAFDSPNVRVVAAALSALDRQSCDSYRDRIFALTETDRSDDDWDKCVIWPYLLYAIDLWLAWTNQRGSSSWMQFFVAGDLSDHFEGFEDSSKQSADTCHRLC